MTDTTDTDGGTAKRTYELVDGVDRVVRSGLVLEGDEQIEAYPDITDDHGDVLQEVTDDE